jgi:ankyrin repeat protein
MGKTDEVEAQIVGQIHDVDDQNCAGWTALHWSCVRGKLDTAKRLIELGADIYLTDKAGLTAFDLLTCDRRDNVIDNLQDLHRRGKGKVQTPLKHTL